MTGHAYEALLHSVSIKNPTNLDLKDFEDQIKFVCENYRWWDTGSKREKSGSKFKRINFGSTRPRPREYENDVDPRKVVKRLVKGDFSSPKPTKKKPFQKRKPRFGLPKAKGVKRKCFFCGETGHLAKACPKINSIKANDTQPKPKINLTQVKKKPKRFCRHCKKMVMHKESECRNKGKAPLGSSTGNTNPNTQG